MSIIRILVHQVKPLIKVNGSVYKFLSPERIFFRYFEFAEEKYDKICVVFRENVIINFAFYAIRFVLLYFIVLEFL